MLSCIHRGQGGSWGPTGAPGTPTGVRIVPDVLGQERAWTSTAAAQVHESRNAP